MKYDPLKDRVAEAVRLFPLARLLFYRLMDIALLRQRYIKSRIAALAPLDANFCFYDAGAGFCQYSHYVLAKWKEARVFATDLKTDYLSEYASFAQKDFPNRFSYRSADLQSFTPDGKYDMAVAIDILEHIEDDRAVLRNFHLCLKPGGHLIISTPSDKDEAARFTAEHVRPGYNKGELEAKLNEVGFSIQESIFSYGFWGALAWRLLIRNTLIYLQRSRLAVILMIPYLMVILPICELMMQFDLRALNRSGNGIIIVARKEGKIISERISQ